MVPSRMRDISGTTAFVTGGSKGIGRAVAVALCRAGVHVTITGRDEATLEASADAIRGTAGVAGEVLPVVADVRDPDALERAAAATVARFGGIDLVVANAGVGHFGSIVDMSADDWHSVIDTNLSGVFHTVKATLDALIERRGMLITIGSLAGVNTFAGGSAYNASKFGLVGFSQAIMLDLRERGVRVSTIMPGSVATHFNGHEPRPEDAWKLQGDDIADTVLYLMRIDERALPSKIEIRPSLPKRA